MIFKSPLYPGRLIKRYKRFLADINLDDGQIITAHCPNPGAMLGIKEAGSRVWVSKSPNLNRKLLYTWEIIEVNDTFIGTNTQLPNDLVYEAIQQNFIPEFKGYSHIKREVKYGKNSRIDILLTFPKRPLCYIEVKNVHLKRGHTAAFPDSVTARGTKHMEELSQMVQQGHQAFLIYVVQRSDCNTFEIAQDIDDKYFKAAKKAFDFGVIPLVYACDVSTKEIKINKKITFKP